MNILKNDKFMLIEEMGKLNKVGEIYEVGNITDTSVIMRDAKTKVAIGAIDIDDFGKYFKKPEDVKHYTRWCGMTNALGEVIAYYRTNGKKVQVRMHNMERYRAEASCCCKYDEFNLTFGIRLAYLRCENKALAETEKTIESSLNSVRYRRLDNQREIKKMLRSLEDNASENSSLVDKETE